ncbi:Protein PLASTID TRANSCRIPTIONALLY ACTIVE 12 [Rhynchospora pubera]|uniref:Protein PLASTID TRANSCRIPTIONALLY ACTIVE 12 n=1 Tax=Rhynchospora pubera TaxID=906938 RepID=A0AAV8D7E9_9POAL|nr:Protein PLASTID TRANSCRIPTIONALLY ACTIVE 12 [Rhynchospora pubera]
MTFYSNCSVLRDGGLHGSVLERRNRIGGSGLSSHVHFVLTENSNLFVRKLSSTKLRPLSQPVQCEKKNRRRFDPSKIEPPPYHVYMDSTSGRLEPASGSRASIPDQDYWPEGTQERVRAAQAPAPKGISKGSPSYGKSPGSRRSKGYKTQAKTSDSLEPSQTSDESKISELTPSMEVGAVDGAQSEAEEDEYVVYQTEENNLTGYDLDKQVGNPHPFINLDTARTIENVRTSDDLWWNWRRSERWSRWQKKRPDVDRVFAKAMAETGQIKIFGDEPSEAEVALAKARKNVYKEERLKAEDIRLKEIGPIAYYSEWVKAYEHIDTSREAVQRHFEETGEDENRQLMRMFSNQTAEEYRIMMGTDIRIKRDPLAMRMREDLIKEIWGGDPVYPTVNYEKDPDEYVDYRSPDFHEHIPCPLSYLLENRFMTPADEFEKMMAKEKETQIEQMQISAMDKALSTAVDIGEDEEKEENEGEEIKDGWGQLESSKNQPSYSKDKGKTKEG